MSHKGIFARQIQQTPYQASLIRQYLLIIDPYTTSILDNAGIDEELID